MDAVPDGIRFAESQGVATLTLDRPDKHNALTLAMRRYIERLPETMAARPDIRCLVIDAVGPSFCAGADLAEISAAEGPIPPTNPAAGLRALAIPTIAAVHATCLTGGLELALATDIVVAARSARFADTHTRMDALPRWGMSAALPRRVGSGRALEMSLTNRWVPAPEAYDIGLVDVLVDDGDLTERVRQIAVAATGPDNDVVSATLALMTHANDGSLEAALAAEVAAWRASADAATDL